MAIHQSILLKYYKRKEIQEALVQHAQQKEVGVRYDEAFGKRPDILLFPREVINLALQNATSFHASEELWDNPLALVSNLPRKNLDELRVGWDLVLDIDCKILDYSKIAADLILKFLQYTAVKDLSVKFSGNKGFHIGIPFDAFPKNIGTTATKDLFPEAPKKIAWYVKENIKEELGRKIMEFENGNISAIKEKTGLHQEDIVRYQRNEFGDSIAKLNVEKFLAIDTILLSSRHLYRMPYSLHEKSGLASIPLNPGKVMEFVKETARPEGVILSPFTFLNRAVQGETARQLLLQALDFDVKTEVKEYRKEAKRFEEIVLESPIKEEFFPPCMQKILAGLDDGRKRGVFCLMNYLGKIGWSKAEIEEYLKKWNAEKNREPLREVYIKGQLRLFKPGDKLPPNCDNEAYYKDMGVHCNAEWCSRLKNPVNYTLSRWKRQLRDRQEEEEKEQRKGRKKKAEQGERTEQAEKSSTPGAQQIQRS